METASNTMTKGQTPTPSTETQTATGKTTSKKSNKSNASQANWKHKPPQEWTNEDILAMPESEYMGEDQKIFFRHLLLQVKQDILSNAGQTTAHLRSENAMIPDPTDRATIEEEHALELRTRDRERKLLKKIEQSLTRIDTNEYGYCAETGEPIGIGRLLARPTATLTLDAQHRRELKQRLFGG